MQSRSSRLFIVLLHLVGVSTNLPQNIWGDCPIWAGIVGVHPMAILLESLELESSGGLDGLLNEITRAGYSVDDVLSEPYWLQDDSDGKCFGPEGFSECGDATLWLVRRQKRSRARSSGGNGKGGGSARDDSPADGGDNDGDDEADNSSQRRGGLVSSLFSSWRGRGDKDESSWGYALELIDGNLLSSSSSSVSNDDEDADGAKKKKRRWGGSSEDDKHADDEGECLISRIDDGEESASSGGAQGENKNLRLGPCSSAEAWTWRINGDGVLVQDDAALELAARRKSRDGGGRLGKLIQGSIPQLESSGTKSRDASSRNGESSTSSNCVWRLNTTAAAAGPCNVSEAVDDEAAAAATPIEVRSLSSDRDARLSAKDGPQGNKGGDDDDDASDKRLVGFSLIRYQATASGTPALPSLARTKAKVEVESVADPSSAPSSDDSVDGTSSQAPSDECEAQDTTSQGTTNDGEVSAAASQHECNVPTTTRTSQSHASGPAMHPELKPVSELLFTSVSPNGGTRPPKKKSSKKQSSLLSATLVGASPLTLGAAAASSSSRGSGSSSRRMPQKPTVTASAGGGTNHNRHLLHHPPTPSMGGSGLPGDNQVDDAPHKPRKMPVHMYIASSTDGVWEDPDTGLEYLTDLSGYLGHDRKEKGRHTLMGVGQYTRTVFKIKVYGCALYVTKRDALADAGFVPFATQTSEELRGNDNFYDHLMTNDPTEDSFDRTLFIKINMQLATEVMRNSLDSDWKLLTPEHKDMLISSSLNPRAAEESMLRKIESKGNPSKCSCGQTAPEEYGADPSCCARGTELAFTWTKNGNLELRMDGRVMDTFPDPELAKGIFYEYLRGDDPMSMEARDRFADGFPFLLAPLSQVKGVSSPVLPHEGAADTPKKAGKKGFGVLRLFGTAADALSTQTAAAQDWVHTGADEMKSNVANAMKAAEHSARNVHAELEKRRVMAWDRLMSLPNDASHLLARMPFGKEHGTTDTRVAVVDFSSDEDEEAMNRTHRQAVVAPKGRVFRPPTGRAPEETDEIGVIIHPTMNFTHRLFLYMVHFYLMLLLIVSVPGSYSTRLVVKRPGGSRSKSVTSSDDESDDEAYCSMIKMDSGKERPSGLRGLEVSLQVRLRKEEKMSQEPGLWVEDSDNEEDIRTKGKADNDRETSDSQQQTNQMTKSLSYYL